MLFIESPLLNGGRGGVLQKKLLQRFYYSPLNPFPLSHWRTVDYQQYFLKSISYNFAGGTGSGCGKARQGKNAYTYPDAM